MEIWYFTVTVGREVKFKLLLCNVAEHVNTGVWCIQSRCGKLLASSSWLNFLPTFGKQDKCGYMNERFLSVSLEITRAGWEAHGGEAFYKLTLAVLSHTWASHLSSQLC
jgi:hypothetical protein